MEKWGNIQKDIVKALIDYYDSERFFLRTRQSRGIIKMVARNNKPRKLFKIYDSGKLNNLK